MSNKPATNRTRKTAESPVEPARRGRSRAAEKPVEPSAPMVETPAEPKATPTPAPSPAKRSLAFELQPATDRIRPMKQGTKVAAVLDLLSAKEGTTLAAIQEKLSSKSPARNFLRFDIHFRFGYGVRVTEDNKAFLVLPKTMRKPLDHVTPE